MTPKLSNWSAPGEKPPCVGVWATDYLNKDSPTYQYFDGAEFRRARGSPYWAYEDRNLPSACNQSTVRFRGLAEKPE